MTEHYFSTDPRTPDRRRRVSVRLAGRELELDVASGTFSSSGLDRGTKVLLDNVAPPPHSGTLVDLGCGWGPIALTLGLSSPDAEVFAVDVNPRARELTATNAQAVGADNVTVCAPEDFPAGTAIDVLWSNPPIRIGKLALHALLTTWLGRLAPTGEAWLVVSKDLGADSLMAWLGSGEPGDYDAVRVETDKGFRVIRVRRKNP